jgi:hypothetical protein
LPNEITSTLPILFLDIDDVLCLNVPYTGYDVIHALHGRHVSPDEVFREVFDARARGVLESLHGELAGALRYVISSTWREVFDRDQMRQVLERGGLGFVSTALHERWRTPTAFERGMRSYNIAQWLDAFHRGEPFAIVDDTFSGPSLKSALSRPTHPFHGRVVLCDENVGLLPEHVDPMLAALRRPATLREDSGQ